MVFVNMGLGLEGGALFLFHYLFKPCLTWVGAKAAKVERHIGAPLLSHADKRPLVPTAPKAAACL